MLILKGDVGVLFKVPDDLHVACLLDYCNEYSHTQQTLSSVLPQLSSSEDVLLMQEG